MRDGKYTIYKLCCWCRQQLSKCLLRFSNTDGEERAPLVTLSPVFTPNVGLSLAQTDVQLVHNTTLTSDSPSGSSRPVRWYTWLRKVDGGVQGWALSACCGRKQESLECSCGLYLLISSQWNSMMPTGPHGELSKWWSKCGVFLLICARGTFITCNNNCYIIPFHEVWRTTSLNRMNKDC